eukprot:COSAG06_NODE_3164_length_5749_cov_16.498407_1_plen_332_part_00
MEESGAQDEALASRTNRVAALSGADSQSVSMLYDSPLARKMRLLAAELEAEEMDVVADCDIGDVAEDQCEEKHEIEGQEGETQAAALATEAGEETGVRNAPILASTPLAGTEHPDIAHCLQTDSGETASVADSVGTGADGPPQVGEPASDYWYYIDRSGVEQGPHPLAHMRYWVETAAIPMSTLVRPCATGAFLPVASFAPIVRGIAAPGGPGALLQGPADEALDRTSSVTKARAKRSRRPPSKRRVARAGGPTMQDVASPSSATADVAADPANIQQCLEADVVEATADVVEATGSLVAAEPAAKEPTTSQAKKVPCACCGGRPDNGRRRV